MQITPSVVAGSSSSVVDYYFDEEHEENMRFMHSWDHKGMQCLDKLEMIQQNGWCVFDKNE